MGNMSYCRFQNTAQDLDECQEVIESLFDGTGEQLSERELIAAKHLVATALDIVMVVIEADGLSAADLEHPDMVTRLSSILDEANSDAAREGAGS